MTQQKEGGMSGQRKRRRGSTKVLAKRSKASAAGMEQHIAERGSGTASLVNKGSQHKIPIKRKLEKPLIISLHKEVEYYLKTRPQLVKLPNEKVLQAASKQLGEHSSETGRKYSVPVNNGSPTQGSQDANAEKAADVSESDCMKKVVEMVNAGGLSDVAADDQYLLCNAGLHSAMTVDDSSSHNADGEKVADLSKADCMTKEVELVNAGGLSNMAGEDPPLQCSEGMHFAMTVDDSKSRDSQIDGKQNQHLPFVKSSPVWRMLETMAVYQKMTQNPHFKPLIEIKEEFREGLAIAHMVNFASTVEKANRLQLKDPVSSFNSSLEILHDLEMHGFDVKAVHGRLNELLSIKDWEVKLHDESKEVQSKIFESSNAKTNLEEEIDEIDKRMSELNEARGLIMSQKEGEGSKICILHSRANDIIEELQRAHLDFERLVTSPL